MKHYFTITLVAIIIILGWNVNAKNNKICYNYNKPIDIGEIAEDSLVLWKPEDVYSQSRKKAIAYYDESTKHIRNRNFDSAIKSLEKSILTDTTYDDAIIRLMDIYRLEVEDPSQLIKCCYKLLQRYPNSQPRYWFYRAKAEMDLGLYHVAREHFKKYLSYKENKKERSLAAERGILNCDFAIYSIQNPVTFEPNNLGESVNTQNSEYLPAITADEQTLLFTRRANNKEDFYISEKIKAEKEVWTSAIELSDVINTKEYNEGAHCITPDGKQIFFTACNRPDAIGRCDIYTSYWLNGEWSVPLNMGRPINTEEWESQPSISADGKTLYFVSNKKGGLGGFDIWKSSFYGSFWSEPINLGENINTQGNEISPFIHPDDATLYFASDGWIGMGKKDLFVSYQDEDGLFQKPKNLGYPINTYREESGLTVTADGTKAYFASDSYKGYGEMDLYKFTLPKNTRPSPITYVKGFVYDSLSKAPLASRVEIIDLEDKEVLYTLETDSVAGTFLATLTPGYNYAINVYKLGYMFYSENFSSSGTVNLKSLTFSAPLQPVAIGNRIRLRNVFFETGKHELLATSEPELNKVVEFMEQNSTVYIEVAGHTDLRGDSVNNMALSYKRAQQVYNYLITKGIAANRLKYQGYGASKPIASNKNEEGRALNRRTEIVIIPELKRKQFNQDSKNINGDDEPIRKKKKSRY